MAQAPWYKGGFILVTISQAHRHSDYAHPRVSVCKLYEGVGREGGGLPADPTEPTVNAQTLISFEFQQNVGGNMRQEHSSIGAEPKCLPWLNLREDGQTGRPYAGHLDTRIRVEGTYVAFRETARQLASIDRALAKLRDRRQEVGVGGAEDDDCTLLVMAMRRAFKLPVLLVVYDGNGVVLTVENPDLSMVDTARRLQLKRESRDDAWGKAAQATVETGTPSSETH